MRVTIQRVLNAKVEVNAQIVGAIQKGLCVFAAIEDADDLNDVNWMAQKLVNLRVFPDELKPMNRSLIDVQGELLLVSQFTLFASTKKGNRPSFTSAGKPDYAERLFEYFKNTLEKKLETTVQTGEFGADMQVTIVNDGPVTINIDSKNRD